MRKILLIVLVFTLFSNASYSQVSFEKGYFIDNSDKKVECLIRNAGWKQNPSQIEYKLTEEGKSEVATIDEIKEFSLPNVGKFQRYKVNIEKSIISKNVNQLSINSEPEFSEELLFLRVLLEGKASLFVFHGKNILKYFYSIDNELPKQLVYKVYRNDNNELRKNNEFRKQLYLHLNCSASPIQNLDQIDYAKKDLMKVFIDFNECEQFEFILLDKKQKRDFLNINARVGVDFSSLYVEGFDFVSRTLDLENQQTVRLGVEFEFILPFNRNKWAFLFEPSYQYYKTSTLDVVELPTVTLTQDVEVDYESIETTLGFRYYIFLNPKSKLFINTGLALDYDLSSSIMFSQNDDLIINAVGSGVIGIGYNFSDKFNVEFRYTTTRTILREYRFWNSYYQKASIIAGYNLF